MARRVLVTGASRGVGRAIAAAFANAGDRVAIHHRGSADLAERLLAELPGEGHAIVRADLTDPDDVRRCVDQSVRELGGLDVVVNNAGAFLGHPPLSVSYDDWQRAWRSTLAVNLLGPVNLTWCAVGHLGTGGRIISVSSRGAFRGEPSAPAYGASKAAINSFTQSMAQALASSGISVTAVAPGFVETDETNAHYKRERTDDMRAQSPFGRVARPSEIAAAVLYLASSEAEWASGTIIDLNGASYFR